MCSCYSKSFLLWHTKEFKLLGHTMVKEFKLLAMVDCSCSMTYHGRLQLQLEVGLCVLTRHSNGCGTVAVITTEWNGRGGGDQLFHSSEWLHFTWALGFAWDPVHDWQCHISGHIFTWADLCQGRVSVFQGNTSVNMDCRDQTAKVGTKEITGVSLN